MSNTKSIIAAAIVAGVSAAVARTEVAANQSAVPAIAESVAQQVEPLIEHATNAEPFYRSQVTVGALVTIVMPLLALVGISSDIVDANQLTAIVMAILSAGGGLFALYGRWKAKRAIGR